MEMVVIRDRRVPAGRGRWLDLVKFLADPAIDETGCHLWNTGARFQMVTDPKTGKQRQATLVAFEISTGTDPRLGTLKRCPTNRNCLNLDHLEFVAHPRSVAKAQPSDIACGNGHPWTEETIYTLTAVRDGVKVKERQCKICRAQRKRDARAREKRWRAMGWTP